MASKKYVITIESLEKNAYRITAEDDTAVATYTTTQPRTVLRDIFQEFKIVGKRGRTKGWRKHQDAGPKMTEEAAVSVD